MSSYVLKLVREESDQSIFLVTGKQGRLPVWCYAQVAARVQAAFKQAAAQPRMVISDYAQVLMSGEGDTPPHEIRELFATHYQ